MSYLTARPIARRASAHAPLAIALAVATCAIFAPVPVATAQGRIAAQAGVAAQDRAVTPLTSPPAPAVLPTTTSTDYFRTPRDLQGCPFQTSPPPPVDESERPRPGQTAQAPPAVPASTVGGEQLGGCDTVTAPGFRTPQMITASGWIVADLDSGEVLAARDSHGRYRPASIIKTLLASVVLDELRLDTIVTVTPEDLAEAEGSMVGVGPGGKYSVDRLLHGLLMASGNDAALVLARELGGVEQTVAKMNTRAAALGAADTHVSSINGLDKPGMMTSAYDMALIFRDAMRRPDFARIVDTQMWGFPGYPAGPGAEAPDPATPPTSQAQPTTKPDGTVVNPGFLLANDNQLLVNYRGAIGGKTGFTDDARHTFIGAAEREGRRLAVVLLDGTREPKAPWEQSAALLDAGFATPPGRSVGTLVPPEGHPAAPQAAAGASGAGGADVGQGGSDIQAAASETSSPVQKWAPWIGLGLVSALCLLAVWMWRRAPRPPGRSSTSR